jgi:hypothetical protein
MKIIFKEDINSDIWNWQECFSKKGSYGQDWKKRKPSDITVREIKDNKALRKYLRGHQYKNDAVKKFAEYIQAAFNSADKIDKDLEKLTGKKVPFKTISVTVTTYPRCPYDYDEGGFFIIFGTGMKWIIDVAYHELMHIIIHKYYWHLFDEAGLTSQEAHDIKESLTVLLNKDRDFKEIPEDKGYASHKKIRKEIEKISQKKHRSFEMLLREIIEVYKKKFRNKK